MHNNHNNMQSVCASRDVCTYQTSSGGIYFTFREEFDLRQTSRLDIDAILFFLNCINDAPASMERMLEIISNNSQNPI